MVIIGSGMCGMSPSLMVDLSQAWADLSVQVRSSPTRSSNRPTGRARWSSWKPGRFALVQVGETPDIVAQTHTGVLPNLQNCMASKRPG